MAAQAASASNELQAEAFKQLYPEQYYAKFISANLRPDGRSLHDARAVSIGINPIGTADSSALVKIGETTAMAGIKLGVPPSLPQLAPCCKTVMLLTLFSFCCAPFDTAWDLSGPVRPAMQC